MGPDPLGVLGEGHGDIDMPPMGSSPLGAHGSDEQDSETRHDFEDESDPFGFGFAD